MAKKISMSFDDNGDAVIKTEGFSGDECFKATEDLKKALGAETSHTKTREFSQSTAVAQQQQKRGR